MMGRKNRDVADEAAEFGTIFFAFLASLGDVLRSAAEWLRLAGQDAFSAGADVVEDRADRIAQVSKAKAKTARRRGRNAILKLVLVGAFLRWLDRDLSDDSRA